MSAQIKAVKMVDVSRIYPAARAGSSKIVQINGRDCEVERIKIDNPAGLDAKIQEIQQLRNSLGTKGMAWFIASLIAAIAITALSIVSVISGAILAKPAIFFIFSCFVPSCLIADNVPKILQKHDRDIRELQSCQKAMRTEEFRTFARQVGDAFTIDELRNVHRLFQNSNNYRFAEHQAQDSQFKVQESLLALRNEIQKEKV